MKTYDEVIATLNGCPETTVEALKELKKAGLAGKHCRFKIAEVLESGVVPIPEDFPCGDACVAYGKAIAEHILTKMETEDAETTEETN